MDSPKFGIRYDGAPGRAGTNGTMFNNVVWRTLGMMVKGDDHQVIGNLALPNIAKNKLEPSLLVRRHFNAAVMNKYTLVEDNAAWLADGGPYQGGR